MVAKLKGGDVTVARASTHVKERWAERANDPGVSIWNAWEDADRIVGTGLYGEETRYHEETGIVLVRNENELVTAIDVATAKDSVKRAVYFYTGTRV